MGLLEGKTWVKFYTDTFPTPRRGNKKNGEKEVGKMELAAIPGGDEHWMQW